MITDFYAVVWFSICIYWFCWRYHNYFILFFFKLPLWLFPESSITCSYLHTCLINSLLIKRYTYHSAMWLWFGGGGRGEGSIGSGETANQWMADKCAVTLGVRSFSACTTLATTLRNLKKRKVCTWAQGHPNGINCINHFSFHNAQKLIKNILSLGETSQ